MIVVVGVVVGDVDWFVVVVVACAADAVKRCVSDKSKPSNAPIVATCVDNGSCGLSCGTMTSGEFSLFSPPGKFAC